MKVLKCNVCGNVVEMINDSGIIPVCCGEEMEVITAKSSEEGNEKHLPVITIEGDMVTVKVGIVEHPMLDNHYINLILIEYGNKIQKVNLKPGEKPTATFKVEEKGLITAYEYCNLHSLWKASIEK